MQVTRARNFGTEHQPSLALNSPYSVTSQVYNIPSVKYLPGFCDGCNFLFQMLFLRPFSYRGMKDYLNSVWKPVQHEANNPVYFLSQILLTWEQLQRDGSDSSNSFGFRQSRSLPGSDCATNFIQVVTCRVLFQNSDSNSSKNLAINFRKSLYQYHYWLIWNFLVETEEVE